MSALNDANDSGLARIAPVLDEAIQELGPDDRDGYTEIEVYERQVQ